MFCSLTFGLFFVSFTTMEEKFIKLTNAVYKVSEFFPEADPLKIRVKNKALVIMENLSLIFGTEGWASMQKESAKYWLSEDIGLLLSYLKIAQKQGWLSPINYLIISNEYENIKKEVGYVKEMTQRLPNMDKPVVLPQNAQQPVLLDKEAIEKVNEAIKQTQIQKPKVLNLSDRQTKILKFLEERQKAQVSDLQTVLLDVTKRTIRRDLDELLKMGKIARVGEWNQVVYEIKEN